MTHNLGTKNLYPLVVSTANVMCTARPWWHKSPPTKHSTPCYSRLQHTNPQSLKPPLRVSDCIQTGHVTTMRYIHTLILLLFFPFYLWRVHEPFPSVFGNCDKISHRLSSRILGLETLKLVVGDNVQNPWWE